MRVGGGGHWMGVYARETFSVTHSLSKSTTPFGHLGHNVESIIVTI